MILHWDAGTLVLEGVGPDEVPDDFVWDERVGRARAPAHAYYAFVMDLHRRGVPLDDRGVDDARAYYASRIDGYSKSK